MFMNTSLRAAVHLEQDFFFKKDIWKTTGQLFRETEKPDSDLSMLLGTTPLGGSWSDVYGFLKLPDSCKRWRSTATSCIPLSTRSSQHPTNRPELPLRSVTSHTFSTMALLAKDTNDDSFLKERSAPYHAANKSTKQARIPATVTPSS